MDTLLIAPQLHCDVCVSPRSCEHLDAATLDWRADLRAREHPGSPALGRSSKRARELSPLAQDRSVADPLRARVSERRRSRSTGTRSSKATSTRKESSSCSTDDDFKAAAIESSKTIEILDFVKSDEIDPRYFETPYYVVPAKGGEKAYALLREAIKRTGMVGIGKITMRTNSLHLAGIKAVGDAIVLEIMRFEDELVDVERHEFPSDDGRASAGTADGGAARREPVAAVRSVEVHRRLSREPDEDHSREDEGKKDRRARSPRSARARRSSISWRGCRRASRWARSGRLRDAPRNAERTRAPRESRRRGAKRHEADSRPCSPPSAPSFHAGERLGVRAEVRRHSHSRIRVEATASRSISRNGIDKTRQFPEIADALRELHARAKRPFVIDGEIVAHATATHRRAFRNCRAACTSTDRNAIERHRADSPAALMVFDMLARRKEVARSLSRGACGESISPRCSDPAGRIPTRCGSATSPTTARRMLREARDVTDGKASSRSAAMRAYDAGPTIARVAQAQDRAPAGVRRRRLDRAAQIARAHRRAPPRLLRRRRSLVYAGHTGTGFSRNRCSTRTGGSRRLERKHVAVFDDAAHERDARTGRGRQSSSRSSSTSGPRTENCVSRSSSACATTRRRAKSSREPESTVRQRRRRIAPTDAPCRAVARAAAAAIKPTRSASSAARSYICARPPNRLSSRDAERDRATDRRTSKKTAAAARWSCRTASSRSRTSTRCSFRRRSTPRAT